MRILTIKDASRLLRISTHTLYKWTCKQKIPFYKIGKRVLFDEQKLLEWIEKHEVLPIEKVS